jgi:hypothetical protein
LLPGDFLLGLLFDSEDGGDVPSKRRMIFTGLHTATTQKKKTIQVNNHCP